MARQASLLMAMSCLLFALSINVSQSLAAAPVKALVESEEWQSISRLWQTMLDHSSNVIYNAARCRELAKDMETADNALTTLTTRGALPKIIAEELRKLIHMRYRYLTECHYTTRSTVRVSEAEACVTAAQWVVEMQLALLRRPPETEEAKKLADAAAANLIYQLTFLHHAYRFEEEAERRRINLREKEKEGEKIDWDAFDVDYQKRRNKLIAAYHRRDLPRVRMVEELIPYLLSLTRLESPSQGTADASGRSDY